MWAGEVRAPIPFVKLSVTDLTDHGLPYLNIDWFYVDLSPKGEGHVHVNRVNMKVMGLSICHYCMFICFVITPKLLNLGL